MVARSRGQEAPAQLMDAQVATANLDLDVPVAVAAPGRDVPVMVVNPDLDALRQALPNWDQPGAEAVGAPDPDVAAPKSAARFPAAIESAEQPSREVLVTPDRDVHLHLGRNQDLPDVPDLEVPGLGVQVVRASLDQGDRVC